MDTLQCAVLLAKMARFDWEVERRIAIGARYGELIRDAGSKVELLSVRPDRTSVWAQYTVLVEDPDGVQVRMKELGIPTAVHYPTSLHQQPAYQHLVDARQFRISEMLQRRVISLPMSADLAEEQMDQIVGALTRAAKA